MHMVPFFNYQYFHQHYGEPLLDVIRDVIKRGTFIMQKDLEEFEASIAKYLGIKHAIGVANCTDGLILLLRAVGIQPGDEVILPSHTFVATASSVQSLNATPILVECDKDHMIDPESIKKAITSKTKAIMPVQLNGRTCDMDTIKALAKEHGLIIVEDAAQALGSKFKGQYAGTFGLGAAFSFYPAKVLGCLGDAGMIVTNDDQFAEKIYMLRDHGKNKEGVTIGWGYNSRLDNLQAAILNFFFKDYDHIIKRRREIASIYQTELGDLAELFLPPAPNSNPNHFDVFQNYEIEAENRDELQQFLKSYGIGTLRQWGGLAIHQISVLGFNTKLPKTDKMMSKELMIPMNMSLTNDDVYYVCDRIKSFYSKT